MKLTCSQEALSRGLQVVGRGVGSASSSSLPVLSNILLASDDGRLRLSSTDLKIGITLWIPAMIFQDGAVTLPARLLTDFLNSLPNEQVDISVNTTSLLAQVKCSRFSTNIKGIDADEFPLIPTISDAPSATVSSGLLRDMIGQVVFAASTDTTRGPLQGVNVTFSGQTLTMAASDGFRMSLRTAQLPDPCKGDFSVLIPARTVAELGRVLPDEDGTSVAITVTPNRGQILFHLENLDFLATLQSEQFVNYKQFIPKSYKTRIITSTADLQKAVKIAGFFAKDSAGSLKLAIETGEAGGTVTVSATTQDIGDAASVVDGVVEGEGLQIGFNSKYIADALNVMKSQQVALELVGPQQAGVLRPVSDVDFLHIIMPVSVPR